MREFMNITKALSDEKRIRALMALQKGELCVCQITELLGLAVSTVSKHLSILYQAGLVETRKDGRWIYYRLPDRTAPATILVAIEWVKKSLAENPRIAEDTLQLKNIVQLDPNELCKRKCQK